jgi:hypothetical protein
MAPPSRTGIREEIEMPRVHTQEVSIPKHSVPISLSANFDAAW